MLWCPQRDSSLYKNKGHSKVMGKQWEDHAISGMRRMAFQIAGQPEPHVANANFRPSAAFRKKPFKEVDLGWTVVRVPLRSDGKSIWNVQLKVRRSGTLHMALTYNEDGNGCKYRTFWKDPTDGEPYGPLYYRRFVDIIGILPIEGMINTLKASDGRNIFFERAEIAAKSRGANSGKGYDLPPGWMREQYLRQRGLCAISGMPMFKDREQRSPYQPAIDRIDSSLGYTEDNCRLICHMVNIARADYDDETFLTMCKACLSHSVAAE